MSRDDDDAGTNRTLDTGAVDIHDTADLAGDIVIHHPIDERLTDHHRPVSLSLRQICPARRRLRSRRAPRGAPSTVATGRPTAVLSRVDGNRRRERVRPKRLGAPSQHLTVPIETMRNHRQRVRFRCERTAFSGNAKIAFDLRIIWSEVVVADRPVDPYPFR